MGPDGQLRAYSGRDVLVLGATGFIGRWLAWRLRREGACVHVAARNRASAEALRTRLGLGGSVSVFDAAGGEVAGVVRDLRPCVTFNLVGYGVAAGETDEAESRRVNGAFVRELCEGLAAVGGAADWPGATLVQAGSQLEYGPIGERVHEDALEVPNTVYGRSKLEGTRAVREAARSGLRGVTARMFNVYGGGEHAGRLLPSLVAAAATGGTVALTAGLQALDFVYVGDVAEGLMRIGAVTSPPGVVVNLATGVPTRVRDFALTAANLLGLPHERLNFGELPARPLEMRYEAVSTERLRALTGWTPPTAVVEGIRRSLWEAPHGP